MQNDRYKMMENASIYSMRQAFNELVSDLAVTGFKNLLTNPKFDMKTGTKFQGWVSNVVFTMQPEGIYYSAVNGTYIRQKLVGLEPGHKYAAVLDLKTTADLKFRVFGAAGNADIVNPFDPSQVDEAFTVIPLVNPASSWRRYLVFFETRQDTMSGNDVYVEVIATGAGSVWLKQAMVYEGFVEVHRLPAREHLIENTRYNGTTWELTSDGFNWHPILIDDGFFLERVQDIVGDMVGAGSNQYGITVTYNDTNGKLDFNVHDFTISVNGEAHGSVTITNLASATLNITLDAEAVQDYVGAMVSSNTENGISVMYNDATGKLDFDVVDFTITLAGDVSGSGTVTNLGNVTISTTVADDSHSHSNTTLSSIDWSKILNRPTDLVSGGPNGDTMRDDSNDIIGYAITLTFGGTTYYVPAWDGTCGCTCTCTCTCTCNCNHSKCAKW